MVPEKGAAVDVFLGLSEKSMAQREDGDDDGAGRAPPAGDPGSRRVASAGNYSGRLLRRQQNLLRRLTRCGNERDNPIGRRADGLARRVGGMYRTHHRNT